MQTKDSIDQTEDLIDNETISSEVDNEEPELAENTTLEAELEQLKEENQQLQDKLLRQLAESENIRRRANKSVEEARTYANFNFAKDLVPVMDNLCAALAHLPSETTPEMDNIIQGVKMTKSELEKVFQKHELETIEPQPSEPFDYNYHHAIAQVADSEYAVNSVVGLVQVGYKIKDRLIRPAMVSVAKSN